MIAPVMMSLICLAFTGISVRLFYRGLRKTGAERVLERLNLGQPEKAPASSPVSARLHVTLLRAGLVQIEGRIGLFLAIWALLAVLGLWLGGGWGLLLMVVLPPLIGKVFVSWRYQQRMRRIIEQLPSLLDHAVRSLKAGRTLTDAMLGGIEVTQDPLHEVMLRVQRNVQMGVELADAIQDLAELYELEELRMLALGLRINHRFGGNASDLLENLIKVIRERDQGARQLRAMTGETRLTAYVLALLPLAMVGYFLLTNPGYLMSMWNDTSGQHMLLTAFGFQAMGSVALWRMLRSI
jgi:tight adherence protein B